MSVKLLVLADWGFLIVKLLRYLELIQLVGLTLLLVDTGSVGIPLPLNSIMIITKVLLQTIGGERIIMVDNGKLTEIWEVDFLDLVEIQLQT